MENITFDNGMLYEVFKMMQIKVKNMQDKERDCSLTIDEMSISPSTEYDMRTVRIMGEVTLPGHGGKATHAMVFMLAGINTRWKQTIAYYFTGNSVFGSVLKPIVCNILMKASHIGLNVLNITTDMGSCNQAMWRTFGISCGRKQRTVNKVVHPADPNKYLYFLADAPHVIKNMKALLVNGQDILLPDWVVKENQLTTNIVSSKPLRILLDVQGSMQLKISPGLTEKVLAPNHFDKMKVSNALSFFSNSNSAGLEYLVYHQSHSTDLLTTAWFLKTINRWFDLISSRCRIMALSLQNVDRYQECTEFLRSIIRLFEEMKVGTNGHWKPVQTGVILTTQSILDICSRLLTSGYKFVLTSRFTSDCIENLFSCVRTNNPVPTPLEFKNRLRLLTVAQFLKVKASHSYQDDGGSFLIDFASAKAADNSKQEDADEDIMGISFEIICSLPPAELPSLYYLTGYLVSRVLKSNSTCSSCISCLSNSDDNFDAAYKILLHLKAYQDGCLISPSETVFEMIKTAEQVFRSTALCLFHHRKNVKQAMLSAIEKACEDFKLPSCHQLKKILLSRFTTLRLHIWAKDQRLMTQRSVGKTENGELGSKSMAMRAVIKTYR